MPIQTTKMSYGATEAEFLADVTIYSKGTLLEPSDKHYSKEADGLRTFAQLPRLLKSHEDVAQTAHGFLAADLPIAASRNSTGAWIRATGEVDGIISAIRNADAFSVVRSGRMDTSGMGLTPNTKYYFINNGVGFNITATEPTAVGSLYKELFRTGPAATAEVNIQLGISIQDVISPIGAVIDDAGVKKIKVNYQGSIYYITMATALGGGSAGQLAAPTMAAPSAVTASSMTLSWTNVVNESSYLVERSLDNVTWGNGVTVGVDVLSLNVTGLAPSTLYYFRVTAIGDTTNYTNSPASNVVNATTSASGTTTPLTAPTLDPPQAITNGTMSLSWVDVLNESGYAVERSLDGTTFTVIENLAADRFSLEAIGLNASSTYHFRMKALGGGTYGDSPYSNVVSATTLAASTTVLSTPTLHPVSNHTRDSLAIGWGNISGEGGYIMQISTDGVNWSRTRLISADTTNTTYEGLLAATTYHFRVMGKGTATAADSAFSAVVTGTTKASTVTLGAYAELQKALSAYPTAADLITSKIISLPAPATAGNLIFLLACADKNPTGLQAPAGFTLIGENYNASISYAVFYKIAAGGEQSFTITSSVAQQHQHAVIEIPGIAATGTLGQTAFNNSNGTTNVKGVSCGSIAATLGGVPHLAVSFMVNDTATSAQVANEYTFNNGFSAKPFLAYPPFAHPGILIGIREITADGTVTTAGGYTTGASDQHSGGIILFKRA